MFNGNEVERGQSYNYLGFATISSPSFLSWQIGLDVLDVTFPLLVYRIMYTS